MDESKIVVELVERINEFPKMVDWESIEGLWQAELGNVFNSRVEAEEVGENELDLYNL